MVIAFADLDFAGLIGGNVPDEQAFTADVKRRLEGRTASQVLAVADSLKEAARQEELRQVEEEIGELQERRDLAEAARTRLAQFEVERARFIQRRDRLGMAQPIIELAVRSGTDHAISRAYFRGTLASPGRSVPWLREGFNYSIRGGLEPGESASWSLAPNMFGPWGDVDPPADAILTVEVVRLDGPDEEPLFAQPFTDWDVERLDGLLDARRRLHESAPR